MGNRQSNAVATSESTQLKQKLTLRDAFKQKMNKAEESMLLMNMEDTSTEDFQLEYLAYENSSGSSMPIQQLFAEQVNPSYVDDEYLQVLASYIGNTDTWKSLGAKQKKDQLWKKIAADQTPAAWLNRMGLFVESMEPTMQANTDSMPEEGSKYRQKFIHGVGAVGKVNFKSNGKHDFTGIFEGATEGLVRFSAAGLPSAQSPLSPGLGLKFLRAGQDSANLVAMYGLTGQPEWNFFEHDWNTWLSPPPRDLPQEQAMQIATVGCKFGTATTNPDVVGVSNFATHSQDGKKVSSPKHPYGLKFAVRPQVKGVFNKLHGGKKFAGYMEFVDTLKAVPENVTLYDVYALDKPDGKLTLIGTLNLDGKLITSKFGDESLFFKHQDINEDFVTRPDLKSQVEPFKCPIPKSMLPF